MANKVDYIMGHFIAHKIKKKLYEFPDSLSGMIILQLNRGYRKYEQF